MAELDVAGYQATLQALSEARAQLERAVPASLAMHRYASAVLAGHPDQGPALKALLQLHVDQTPGAVMPDHIPDDWPPYVPYVVLRALARWLAALGEDPDEARVVAVEDIARKARYALNAVALFDDEEAA